MIIFNEDFKFERDKYQWLLHHTVDGWDKKHEHPKRHTHTTFHATLEQICGAIIERSAGECKDLEEIKVLLRFSLSSLTDHVEELVSKEPSQ